MSLVGQDNRTLRLAPDPSTDFAELLNFNHITAASFLAAIDQAGSLFEGFAETLDTPIPFTSSTTIGSLFGLSGSFAGQIAEKIKNVSQDQDFRTAQGVERVLQRIFSPSIHADYDPNTNELTYGNFAFTTKGDILLPSSVDLEKALGLPPGSLAGAKVTGLAGKIHYELSLLLGVGADIGTPEVVPVLAFRDPPGPSILAQSNLPGLVAVTVSDLDADVNLGFATAGIVNGHGATRGTVAAGATTTQFAGTSGGELFDGQNDYYKDRYIHFYSGPLAGQARRIASYIAASRTFILDSALPVAPGSGTAFQISREATALEDEVWRTTFDVDIDKVGGTVGSFTESSLTDPAASFAINALAGSVVTITSGTGKNQSRVITSNTATSLQLDSPWDKAAQGQIRLSAGDSYRIFTTASSLDVGCPNVMLPVQTTPAIAGTSGTPRFEVDCFSPVQVYRRDLDQFDALGRFDPDALKKAFGDLVALLEKLENLSFLGTKLPIVNKSLTDLVPLSSAFRAAFDELTSKPLGTLDAIKAKLSDAIRLRFSSTIGLLDVTVTIVGDDLKIGVSLSDSRDLTTGFDFDVKKLASELPTGSPARTALEAVSNIAQIAGTANLTFHATSTLNLNFGIGPDPAAGGALRPFLFDNSNATRTLKGGVTGLNLSVAIGPLAAAIANGSVSLHAHGNSAQPARFGFDFSGDADHRVFSSELTAAAGINLDGALDANLPFTFQNNPLDEPLEFSIPDLENLGGAIVTQYPNFAGLLNNIDLIDYLIVGADQLESMLDGISGRIDQSIPKVPIPFIRDAIGSGFDLASHFVTGVHDTIGDLKTALKKIKGQSNIEPKIAQAIFAAFAPMGILGDRNGKDGVTVDDITVHVDVNTHTIEIDLQFARTLSQDFPIDLGLSAIGINFQDSLKANLGFTFDFGFGVSKDNGFYLKTSTADEIHISANLGFHDVNIGAANLFVFLISGKIAEVGVHGSFAIDLDDPSHDGKLTITEIAGAKLGDLFTTHQSLGFNFDAPIHLELNPALGLNGAPELDTTFEVTWQLGDDAVGVRFVDTRLDFGKFLTKILKPVLENVNAFFSKTPIKQVIELVTKDISLLTDLNDYANDYINETTDKKEGVSILDVANTFFGTNPYVILANIVVAIADVTDKLDFSSSSLVYPLGTISLTGDPTNKDYKPGEHLSGGSSMNVDAQIDRLASEMMGSGQAEGAQKLSQAFGRSSTPSGGYVKTSWPLLEDPTQAFKIIFGQEVNIFQLETPEIFDAFPPSFIPRQDQPLSLIGMVENVFKFDVPQFFEDALKGVSPDLKARFDYKFQIPKLVMGYDTYVLSKKIRNENVDLKDIFNGFFIEDPKINGQSVPVFNFEGVIEADFNMNDGIVSTHGKFRLGDSTSFDGRARVNVFLDDANHDGKVRLNELSFDAVGRIDGSLDASLKVEIFESVPVLKDVVNWLGKVTGTKKVIEQVLHSFEDGYHKDFVLLDSIGEQAHVADYDAATGILTLVTTPENDLFSITQSSGSTIVVRGGSTQIIAGVPTLIRGDLGGGNDRVLVAAGVAASAEISGGDDDDELIYQGDGSATLKGGAGNDTLTGGDHDDSLDGEGGNDSLIGNGGSDSLVGGDDNDTLAGGDGRDTLTGGSGNDRLSGGRDADLLQGDDDEDTLIGGGGNDTLEGGGGNDQLESGADVSTLRGGSGNDRLLGGGSGDLLEGDSGNDYVQGGGGNDTIDGGSGEDQLDGGSGNDTIMGGSDNDVLIGGSDNDLLQGGSGDDVLNGGDGEDKLFGDAGADELHGGANNDTLEGGGDNDRLYGEGGQDSLDGGFGDDRLEGGTENDVLDGGAGRDTLDGGSGNDRLSGGADDDLLIGGAGSDTLIGQGGRDVLWTGASQAGGGSAGDVNRAYGDEEDPDTSNGTGSSQNDTIFGDLGRDLIFGGPGGDRIDAGPGDDDIQGNAGDDVIFAGTGRDTVQGGSGNDTIYAGLDSSGGGDKQPNLIYGDSASALESGDPDQIFGDLGSDTIFAGGGADVVNSLGGRDLVHGGPGNDVLSGGDDDDTVFGEAGNDRIEGGDGNDLLDGGDDRDTILGGRGNDKIAGGSGNDTLIAGLIAAGDGPSDEANLLYGDEYVEIRSLSARRDGTYRRPRAGRGDAAAARQRRGGGAEN